MDGQRVLVASAAFAGLALAATVVVVVARRQDEPVASAPPTAVPWEPFTPSPAVTVLPPDPLPASVVSDSPSATVVPSRRPTATATAVLSLAVADVPGTVDLAAEGTRDWVHWGLESAEALDRKSRGTGEIQDDRGTSARGRYDNNPELFGWSGGTPTGAAGRTPTGVYSCGAGSRFTLRVPAGAATRTLRFYAGVWMAEGQMTVSLAGKRATASLENREAIRTGRFTIRFRAPAGNELVVTWTARKVFHPTCGNIDMQAATLS
ncbi:hypothetical protein Ato02nite_086020 [Paractinoplanes toevensis]|uniref:Uncharacterized protein n=2 Tax=Paractinoplanes toevensis TaxID=571911 RepID=A0A920BPY0_9ACTN|nr:hypothetical protein Ato02nite_086020 [Actinoplanes toevensis]